MKNADIRWLQRFSNFERAFSQLEAAVDMDSYSDLELQGLIKTFEFTYELAWNTLKELLEYKGITGIVGSKDTVRTAYKEGLISDGELWMKMIQSRNQSSHTYNGDTAKAIKPDIHSNYYFMFRELIKKLNDEKAKEVG